MRTARLVGPTADGTSVVLVTEDGEELSVAIDPDDRAGRAFLEQARGASDAVEPAGSDAPAEADAPVGSVAPDEPHANPTPLPVRRPPRRRETPMDTPLSPRDIQTRIRAGESLEDVVAGSGMEAERIERFAAPVLAEREHLALTALGSSVRRRGEASGHRPLRSVVAERLQAQGVDGDDVSWDAWKVADSQWQLSADYEVGGEPRHAEFRFDAQGRFSVAEDDEARWLAGEAPSPVTSVEREDELALVRATREPSRDDAAEGDDLHDDADDDAETMDDAERQDLVRAISEELGAVLQVVPPAELSVEELAELAADDPESDERDGGSDADFDSYEPRSSADDEPTLVVRDEAAEPTIAVVRHLTRLTLEVDTLEVDTLGGPDERPQTSDDETSAATAAEDEARSALDTLYDMLGGYTEESPRVYAGLSDAAAVPVVDEHEFEPPADVLVPAEPGADDDTPDAGDSADAADGAGTADVQPAPVPAAVEVADAGADDDEEKPVSEAPPEDVSGSVGSPIALGGSPTLELGSSERPQLEAAPEPSDEPEELPLPVEDDAPEPLIPSPGASRKPGRRKRASVPSWDEIMFGGPKPG
jgi:hypothetical protein